MGKYFFVSKKERANKMAKREAKILKYPYSVQSQGMILL